MSQLIDVILPDAVSTFAEVAIPVIIKLSVVVIKIDNNFAVEISLRLSYVDNGIVI